MNRGLVKQIVAIALWCCVLWTPTVSAQLVAQWTQQATPKFFPQGVGWRTWTNLTFDSLNGQLLLFGGGGGPSSYLNDIWSYDTLADIWTPIEVPAERCPGHFGFGGPDARDTLSAQYDPVNNLLWVIGGGGLKCGPLPASRTAQSGSDTTTIVDSTLPADVAPDFYKDWTVIANNNQAYVSSYDPQTKTLKLASSIPGVGPNTSYSMQVWTRSGTWYYSLDTREWRSFEGPHWGYSGPTPFVPSTLGIARNANPALAYSSTDQVFVMFAGDVIGGTNATWVLDLNNKSQPGHPAVWAENIPNGSPDALFKRVEVNGAMVYDSRNDVFVLFGGKCSEPRCPQRGGPLGDTWVYKVSTNTWTQMHPPVSPSARAQHQMAYDSDNGAVILFGGVTVDSYAVTPTTATTLNDVWIYDYPTNTWTEITPTTSPPGRYIGTLAYDPAAKLSVLLGGLGAGKAIQYTVWTLKLSDSSTNQSPVAVAKVTPSSGLVGTTFSADAAGSHDPDGNIVSYLWDFGDATLVSGQTASHKYSAADTYTVRLTVQDNKGAIGKAAVTVTVSAMDTTPNAFSFAAVTGAPVSAVVTSGSPTISGINAPAPVSVAGGEYSISGAPYTSANGTVSNGQTVRVRLTSSANYSTLSSATLTIGGVSATFNVTTAAKDTTPNAFNFAAVNGAALNALVSSGSQTIAGINAPAPVSVAGGEYSISGGPYTSANATVSNGQTVRVRLTSSANYSTLTSATLTVGGVSATFNVTTGAKDTTPNAFSFVAVSGAPLNRLVTSGSPPISGINAPASVSVVGGEYSISGGPYTSGPSTVNNGQSVRVRLTTSANYSTSTSATLTVGGVSATFNVTTRNP